MKKILAAAALGLAAASLVHAAPSAAEQPHAVAVLGSHTTDGEGNWSSPAVPPK